MHEFTFKEWNFFRLIQRHNNHAKYINLYAFFCNILNWTYLDWNMKKTNIFPLLTKALSL